MKNSLHRKIFWRILYPVNTLKSATVIPIKSCSSSLLTSANTQTIPPPSHLMWQSEQKKIAMRT